MAAKRGLPVGRVGAGRHRPAPTAASAGIQEEQRPNLTNEGFANRSNPSHLTNGCHPGNFNSFRHAAAVGSVSRPVNSRSANNAAR
jgi:hypothetical protein